MMANKQRVGMEETESDLPKLSQPARRALAGAGIRSLEQVASYGEKEIRQLNFDGYLSLHADDTSDGLYGFALGTTHAIHVLAPALRAASAILPRNRRRRIDNFPARNGIVRQRYVGMLGPAPGTRPKPFEVVLETPAHAPIPAQVDASVVALHTILEQHRALLSFSQNL